MVDKTVDYGSSHLFVGEDSTPLRELDIGRQDETLAFVAHGNDPKQELGTFPKHGDVAPFVQNQEIQLLQVPGKAFKGASFVAFSKGEHELRRIADHVHDA